jgi:nitroreductase
VNGTVAANETLRVIKGRRSIRSFRDEQITDGELKEILEAGSYAPNAGGQAWHFTVVQRKEMLSELNLTAKETARNSGIEHLAELGRNEGFDCLYGAPALIIVSGDGQAFVPLEADCAAATQNMLLAAESMGIGSCWIYFALMAFNSPQGPELIRKLELPEGYRPYYAAVFGYKKDSDAQADARKPNLVTYIR